MRDQRDGLLREPARLHHQDLVAGLDYVVVQGARPLHQVQRIGTRPGPARLRHLGGFQARRDLREMTVISGCCC